MYKIKLPNFDGPFDLLLYFIKRDEINIYDIPISRITEEFLKYIRLMKYFDLELAGEFIVMAASLMFIKTQMLLPKSETEEGEEEDPRAQLVQRLVEYKLFKDAAKTLSVFAEEQRYVFYRKLFDVDNKIADESSGVEYKNANLFDLVKALKKALDRIKKKDTHHFVELISISVEEKIDYLVSRLLLKKRLKFFDLIRNEPRSHMIVTFLAILEMMKSRKIYIRQSEIFDDIVIIRRQD